jgi:hypothetical protein
VKGGAWTPILTGCLNHQHFLMNFSRRSVPVCQIQGIVDTAMPPEVAGFRPGPWQSKISRLMIMMRKLAIASLLVAGVALSGSVFAQSAASSSAAPASSSSSTAKHKAKSSSSTSHKSHKKASSSAPASSSTAGK